jgi:hypothetical protein
MQALYEKVRDCWFEAVPVLGYCATARCKHLVIVDSRDAIPGDVDAAIVIPTATAVASHVETLLIVALPLNCAGTVDFLARRCPRHEPKSQLFGMRFSDTHFCQPG